MGGSSEHPSEELPRIGLSTALHLASDDVIRQDRTKSTTERGTAPVASYSVLSFREPWRSADRGHIAGQFPTYDESEHLRT